MDYKDFFYLFYVLFIIKIPLKIQWLLYYSKDAETIFLDTAKIFSSNKQVFIQIGFEILELNLFRESNINIVLDSDLIARDGERNYLVMHNTRPWFKILYSIQRRNKEE